MADLGMIARATKRVTLDDIYNALDALKDQQGEDSRHLNQRIDTVGQRVDTIGERVDNLGTRIDNLGSQVNQRIDQLNQRFDTIMQMLMELSKQISCQKNQ